jgi:hypothetical protein
MNKILAEELSKYGSVSDDIFIPSDFSIPMQLRRFLSVFLVDDKICYKIKYLPLNVYDMKSYPQMNIKFFIESVQKYFHIFLGTLIKPKIQCKILLRQANQVINEDDSWILSYLSPSIHYESNASVVYMFYELSICNQLDKLYIIKQLLLQ